MSKKNEDKIRKYKKMPEKGEYVIATIKELNPNSAIATLDEYDDLKAMIHISEISSRWVKDIRRMLKLNQKVVALVLSQDRKGYVELSIKRVKPTLAREKTKEFRNEKKAHNFLKIIAKELGLSLDEVYEKLGFPLQKEFGSMYEGFEIVAEDGIDVLRNLGVPENIAQKAYELALENIKPKELTIKMDLLIKCYEGDGIEIIKKALSLNNERIHVHYLAAPKYRLELKGEDYKEMEKELTAIIGKIEEAFRGKDVDFNYVRVKGES
ncbi:MAG: S1 RNA-binding domain-containing protein [Candidatus Nanohaloarchaeota archaeon]|nr:S1 RNA-binding domain-containing protein [Candidatus Nanohaloarchaeota archaeon]